MFAGSIVGKSDLMPELHQLQLPDGEGCSAFLARKAYLQPGDAVRRVSGGSTAVFVIEIDESRDCCIRS